MILRAIIDDQEYTLQVPEAVLSGAAEFFDQLDRDMDQGWQMSREWVEAPNRLQRCQIVADKLLSALEKENQKLGMLMAGYILSRLPQAEAVELDVQGEIQNNQFRFRDEASDAAPTPVPKQTPDETGRMPAGLNKIEAMTQAGNDVTKVFKVGKGWRFSVFDHGSGTWQDSPLFATETEADRVRQQALKQRYQELLG